MGAVLSLQVLLRVPIAVVQNHCVGSRQIDAEAAGAGAEEEEFVVGAGVESFDLRSPVFGFHTPVYTADIPTTEYSSVFFQEIQLSAELAEEYDLMPLAE